MEYREMMMIIAGIWRDLVRQYPDSEYAATYLRKAVNTINNLSSDEKISIAYARQLIRWNTEASRLLELNPELTTYQVVTGDYVEPDNWLR